MSEAGTRRALAQEGRLGHLVRPSQYDVLSFDDAFALNRVVQQTTVKFFQALLHRISSLLEWREILAAMSQQKSAIIIFQLRDVVFDHAAQTCQLDRARANLIPMVIAERDKYKQAPEENDDQNRGRRPGKNQMRRA